MTPLTAGPRADHFAERPPHRPRHRVLTLLIVVLLIAVPAGYLVRSAFVSRQSGEDKERIASATNLTYGWPSKVQRRVYDVPVPTGSSRVAWYETNSWHRSVLYTEFRTSPRRLREFLRDVGTDSGALRDGTVSVTRRQAETVGWQFARGADAGGTHHRYAGTTYRKPGKDQPDVAITVDTSYRSRPRVYVVSTASF